MTDLPNSTEEYLALAIAALGTDQFSGRLTKWLQRCFEIDNCTVVSFYQTSKPDVFFSLSSIKQVHESMENDYLSGIYLLDPFHDLHVKKVPDSLYRLKDCAPDHFHRNEYYARYYRRTTLIDEICYHASPNQGVSVQVCLGKDESSNKLFSPRDLRSAQKISSIVCSLIRKNWKDLSASGDYDDVTLLESLQKKMIEHHGIRLSKRQCEVALLILRGHSTVSIALSLNISPQTVKVFRKQLYRKCGISSQAELFALLTPYLVI